MDKKNKRFLNIKKTEEIKKKVIDELIDLGMPMHILGFDYWTYLIPYVYENDIEINNMDTIYTIISEHFNTKKMAGERALRYAVNYTKEGIKEKYNIRNKITNEAFIKLFLLKIL